MFYRYYNPMPPRYQYLLNNASLIFAPDYKMVALRKGDVISECIALTGAYEYALSKKIRDLAKRGGRMVDVGANLGYFSILWASAHRDNTCVAIEASPRNHAMLRQNIEANQLNDCCQIVTSAVGRTSGRMSFALGPEEQTGWGGLSLTTEKGDVEVEVLRLDEVIADDEPIEVLKIDAEGADTWVLQGASSLFKRKQIRHVFFEQHPSRMKALGIEFGEAESLLSDSGYKCSSLNPRDDRCIEYMACLMQ